MNNVKSKPSATSSDSSAPLMSKVKFEQVKEDIHASTSETQSHRLSSDLNSMTMSGYSENSKNSKKEKVVPRSQYKPEKWMLLDEVEDRLSQLNLAIICWACGFWKVDTFRKAATPSRENIPETNAQIRKGI